MSYPKIAPSILSGDFANMGETVKNVEKWGADYVHFDVMDGVYVPNLTFGMPMCQAIRPYTSLCIDAHLMITRPENYVKRFCKAGADLVSFHPEASQDVLGTLMQIKEEGKKCGLALNPDKPLNLVEPYLHLLDIVIIMGVYPGYSGQRFIEDVLVKLATLRSEFDGEIELDGGVTEANAAKIVATGADVLVGGSSVFGSANPEQTIRRLKGI